MMHKTCSINYGHLADLQKHFLQLILTKKKLSYDKISPRDFYFFVLSFQSVLVYNDNEPTRVQTCDDDTSLVPAKPASR